MAHTHLFRNGTGPTFAVAAAQMASHFKKSVIWPIAAMISLGLWALIGLSAVNLAAALRL